MIYLYDTVPYHTSICQLIYIDMIQNRNMRVQRYLYAGVRKALDSVENILGASCVRLTQGMSQQL